MGAFGAKTVSTTSSGGSGPFTLDDVRDNQVDFEWNGPSTPYCCMLFAADETDFLGNQYTYTLGGTAALVTGVDGGLITGENGEPIVLVSPPISLFQAVNNSAYLIGIKILSSRRADYKFIIGGSPAGLRVQNSDTLFTTLYDGEFNAVTLSSGTLIHLGMIWDKSQSSTTRLKTYLSGVLADGNHNAIWNNNAAAISRFGGESVVDMKSHFSYLIGFSGYNPTPTELANFAADPASWFKRK